MSLGGLDPWPSLTREDVEGDVLTTVLPDDVDTVEKHPFDWLAELCAAHGVQATPDDLRAVSYTVVLGQRVLNRLARSTAGQ